MLGVLENTHPDEGRRSLAFEEQMHLMSYCRYIAIGTTQSAVIIREQPWAVKIRVLIRVFGYPPHDCAGCNVALDRYRNPLQASTAL